jgi:hypothetical protein
MTIEEKREKRLAHARKRYRERQNEKTFLRLQQEKKERDILLEKYYGTKDMQTL